jgi:hypothetical protein
VGKSFSLDSGVLSEGLFDYPQHFRAALVIE